LEIEQDHAKNMDNFYRQQFPYDSNLEHVRNELSKQILELNHENKQLKKQNQELQDKLELTEELLRKVELEPGQKLAAQVEIPPK
jgi:chromosome segregation ATPase